MDKRDRADVFRFRLSSALNERDMNRSELARAAALDRSTVSQLLSDEAPRLPNGHALAALAGALGVSTDWLLGLSTHRGAATDILEQAVQFAESGRNPVDEHLLGWYREAVGYKIRHVPSNLPDILKTEPILRHEYLDSVLRTADQAIADTRERLALLHRPETDMEVSVSRQTMEGFARGEGGWSALEVSVRKAQLLSMADMVRELYPSLRLHLFDQTERYSVPFTVFGQKRAAIYLGQRYLAFSATRHVQLFARHFDDLVRAAVVQSHEAGDWIAALAAEI